MHFALTDEQTMIAETARGFFAEQASSERTRAAMARPDGVDAAAWQAFAALGLAGIAAPETAGGAGLGAVELATVIEAAGAWIAALPVVASLGCAIPALAAANEDAWLPRLAAGAAIGSVAEVDGALTGDRLSGLAACVPHGQAADLVVALVGDTAVLVVRGGAGVQVGAQATMDRTRPLARVAFDGAPCVPLGHAAAVALRRWGGLAVAADALGGAQACLDRTVGFAKERVQFGRPIGSFQAVKHRLADVMVEVEQARSAVYWAACAIDERSGDLDLAVHAAKAAACDAYTAAAAAMVQLHGGLGFTWEHDAHLFFKRARADLTLLGTPAWHRERIAALIGLDVAA